MIYITGDVHAKFTPIERFCHEHGTSVDDTLIILGDAGINFHGEEKDRKKKDFLRTLPITLFCLHGNHDKRPAAVGTYEESAFRGGVVYREPGYETILFAKDGDVYDFDGLRTLALGGAYSIDKDLRVALKWPWFEDEQPSEAIRARVEATLLEIDYSVDVVLSHTAPLSHLPFSGPSRFPALNIDLSTERWLDSIEQRLTYEHWYCGHFHIDTEIGRFTFMLDRYLPFGHYRTGEA